MTFGVDADRLTRSRFALSGLAELTNGLEVLAHPARAPYARRWVEQTRRELDLGRVAVLYALVNHGSWYVPDFVAPIPDQYQPSLTDELAAVAATPEPVIRAQLEMAFQIGPPPPEALRRSRAGSGRDPRWPLPAKVADVLAAGGESALAACVAEQLDRCWRAVHAERWPTLRRVLDEDIRHRATEASREGFARIIADLHPRLDWDGTRVTLQHPYEVHVDAVGGLVLTPSVFLPRPAVWLSPAGRVMLGYPARGRGQVWSAPEPREDEAGILGARVAALLADLEMPRSTTELARRHQLSPATVSYHLGRLRKAGLVTRRQAGHSVLYQRTTGATRLLTALDGHRAD